MKIQFPVSAVANRLALTCSVHLLIWLGLWHSAIESAQSLAWLRWSLFAGALIPFHLWLIQEAIESDLQDLRSARRWQAFAFLACAVALGVIPFTDFFIAPASPAFSRSFGVGYKVYVAGVLGMYLAVGLVGLRRLRSLTGCRRLALQVGLAAGGTAITLIVLLMLLSVASHDGRYVRGQPLIMLACYAWAALALSANRTFNPGQFFLVGIEKTILVAAVAAVASLLCLLLTHFIRSSMALITAAALAWALALSLRAWWDRTVRLAPREVEPPPGPAA